MNRVRVMAASAVVVGTLIASGGVFAQGPRAGGRGPGGRIGGPPLPIRELNLSEAQQQQVRVIREQHQTALREAGARVRAAAQAQQAAVQTAPVNEGLIRSTSQAVADAETDLAIEQARIYSETWFVLSPQQQEQLKSLQAQRQSARDSRPERRARRNQGSAAKP